VRIGGDAAADIRTTTAPRALSTDQEQIDRFFGVIAGTVAVPEFLGPVNLARLVATA
jgi:hypothetical protein